MELTDSLKALFIDTAQGLKGSARRLFMARTVKELGPGGQRHAERDLGWSRVTIRKGRHELESGFICLDAFSARGRKRAEDHLPHLLQDIRAIVDGQSQTDPQFRTQRLYTRLSAAEVRRQLIAHKGYLHDELPTVQTITAKLNALGYFPKKVAKSKPQKKLHKPTPSFTTCPRSITMPQPQPTSYGFRSMPKPPSRSAPLPVAAKVGSRPRRPITISSQRPW
jgi:DDE family transposase